MIVRSEPAVGTGRAQTITQTTATLSGTVNSEGAETTYHFAYIDQAGYEKALKGNAQEKANPYAEGETTPTVNAGSSVGEQTVGPTIANGLLPGTTYDYALIAKNIIGIETGPNQTLTTLSGTPPTVTTGGVSGVSQNTATITGAVTTNGLQTNYSFEIGTEPAAHRSLKTGAGASLVEEMTRRHRNDTGTILLNGNRR